jgi:DNA ligase-1
MHHRWLDKGFEGSMLRSPNGMYKHGRSTAKERDLRKFKPFEDIDAVIVEFQQKARLTEEAKERITDKDAFGRSKRGHRKGDREFVEEVGSTWIEYVENGETKRCKAGYTRNSPVRTMITWENKDEFIGKHVDVEFQGTGIKDLLRLPRIKRLRPDLDQ